MCDSEALSFTCRLTSPFRQQVLRVKERSGSGALIMVLPPTPNMPFAATSTNSSTASPPSQAVLSNTSARRSQPSPPVSPCTASPAEENTCASQHESLQRDWGYCVCGRAAAEGWRSVSTHHCSTTGN